VEDCLQDPGSSELCASAIFKNFNLQKVQPGLYIVIILFYLRIETVTMIFKLVAIFWNSIHNVSHPMCY
jgi:hypothetical protein